MSNVAVIGAGITGVTTAYFLQERGHTVSVFDRRSHAAMETSYANGGQLSASNAEVWNRWSTIAHGMRWLLRKDAPLLFNLSPSWHKYSWLAQFLRAVPSYRTNTVATARLALEARRLLLDIADREGIAFDLAKRGILHIYHDKASFDRALSVNALLREAGLDRRDVSAAEVQQIEPALSTSCYGGFFTPSDASGDIHKFVRGLAAVCGRKGVTFVYDAEIQDLSFVPRPVLSWSPKKGTKERPCTAFDAVVICAGVGSRKLAGQSGDRINVYPVKGYSITVHLDDDASRRAAPRVALLDDEAKIVTSRLGDDRLRVAGTAEFNGSNLDIRTARIDPLVAWTRHLFPGIDTSRTVPWSGLRPMMPDMMPRAERGSRPGIYYNTGHGHLGWTLSAATAELIACLIHQDFL